MQGRHCGRLLVADKQSQAKARAGAHPSRYINKNHHSINIQHKPHATPPHPLLHKQTPPEIETTQTPIHPRSLSYFAPGTSKKKTGDSERKQKRMYQRRRERYEAKKKKGMNRRDRGVKLSLLVGVLAWQHVCRPGT